MPSDAVRSPGAPAIALTIAGSDSSGGAGIQADLKTFTALGVYGASVVTALTAQNTRGVQGVCAVDPAFVIQQLDSVISDLNVTAIKTGMLATSAIAHAVALRLATLPGIPIVIDPVMVATSGDLLLAPEAVATYRTHLLPRATLLTPNLPEAARLLEVAEAASVEQAINQARALVALGCPAVLLKGGHGSGSEITDILCVNGEITVISHPRIATKNTHGTGCTLSSAIAAHLALGAPLRQAVSAGIEFLCNALAAGASHAIGAGHGPVDHMFSLRERQRP